MKCKITTEAQPACGGLFSSERRSCCCLKPHSSRRDVGRMTRQRNGECPHGTPTCDAIRRGFNIQEPCHTNDAVINGEMRTTTSPGEKGIELRDRQHASLHRPPCKGLRIVSCRHCRGPQLLSMMVQMPGSVVAGSFETWVVSPDPELCPAPCQPSKNPTPDRVLIRWSIHSRSQR